jgi:hypothetical protein
MENGRDSNCNLLRLLSTDKNLYIHAESCDRPDSIFCVHHDHPFLEFTIVSGHTDVALKSPEEEAGSSAPEEEAGWCPSE